MCLEHKSFQPPNTPATAKDDARYKRCTYIGLASFSGDGEGCGGRALLLAPLPEKSQTATLGHERIAQPRADLRTSIIENDPRGADAGDKLRFQPLTNESTFLPRPREENIAALSRAEARNTPPEHPS